MTLDQWFAVVKRRLGVDTETPFSIQIFPGIGEGTKRLNVNFHMSEHKTLGVLCKLLHCTATSLIKGGAMLVIAGTAAEMSGKHRLAVINEKTGEPVVKFQFLPHAK